MWLFKSKSYNPNYFQMFLCSEYYLNSIYSTKVIDHKCLEMNEKINNFEIIRRPYKYSYNDNNHGSTEIRYKNDTVFQVIQKTSKDFEDWNSEIEVQIYKFGEWINEFLELVNVRKPKLFYSDSNTICNKNKVYFYK